MTWRWLLAGTWLLGGVAACEPATIRVVGGAGDPGPGCPPIAGAPSCPGPGDPIPQLRFEAGSGAGTEIVADPRSAQTLSDLRVTCQRSYCGGGSLAAHAALEWMDNRDAPGRMATFVHVMSPPVDLLGKTLGFSVLVDARTAPFHAQIGVIFDYWRWVAWSPVTEGWNRIEGVVSPANTLTGIDPAVTAIPVTALQIDVYVPVAEASGPNGTWSGEIFLDDIGWR